MEVSNLNPLLSILTDDTCCRDKNSTGAALKGDSRSVSSASAFNTCWPIINLHSPFPIQFTFDLNPSPGLAGSKLSAVDYCFYVVTVITPIQLILRLICDLHMY